MQGSFSVVVGTQIYEPIYGDICFLAPYEEHYGQIPRDMHIDYFQLDIGIMAFDNIPNGKSLLGFLVNRELNPHIFIRPEKEKAQELLDLCYKVENAIREENHALAYAMVIIILTELNSLYRKNSFAPVHVLSKHTFRTVKYIEAHYDEKITIADLAKECSISTSLLSRTFKREMGISVHNYLNRYRILRSVAFLHKYSVTQTSMLCGFSDSSHYILQFKKQFNKTPYEYKKCTDPDHMDTTKKRSYTNELKHAKSV